jgi:hypothetical protein
MNDNAESSSNQQNSYRSQGDQPRVTETDLRQMTKTPRLQYQRAPMNRTAYRSEGRRY